MLYFLLSNVILQ